MLIAGETGGQKSTVLAQIITGFPTAGMVHHAGVRRPFFCDDPKFSELAAAGLDSVTEDGCPPAEVKASQALYSYGADSLLVVEIVNWFYQETKVTLSVPEVLATVPTSELAMKICWQKAFFT
ncbi:hypothetical protein N7G274_001569 [Stereocaulon virgatum]|uniref:Carrier domain-containing protein n=1 Tax=Stereocaulon virgatum TaxID=373712 RepID=A0ABR4AK21_9LECA